MQRSQYMLYVNAEATRIKLENLANGSSIPSRLLNALLTHAPTLKGASVIATDIIAASASLDGPGQLAEFYITGLLLPSKLSLAIGGFNESMVYSEAAGRSPQVSSTQHHQKGFSNM